MRRIIRFKFWDKRKDSKIITLPIANESLGELFADDEIIKMQFTESYDKYGVEIYENDIIEVKGKLYEVVFNLFAFELHHNKEGELFETFYIAKQDLGDFVYVGNRFSHPELIDKVYPNKKGA